MPRCSTGSPSWMDCLEHVDSFRFQGVRAPERFSYVLKPDRVAETCCVLPTDSQLERDRRHGRPRVFERTLAELFTLLGYDVEQTETFDNGADLILSDNGQSTAVEAKRSSFAVGITAVRQLHDGKAGYRLRARTRRDEPFFLREKAVECAGSQRLALCSTGRLGTLHA